MEATMDLIRIFYKVLFSTPERRLNSLMGLIGCVILAFCLYDNETIINTILVMDILGFTLIVATLKSMKGN